jgi:predicted acylesterase/phospholipase RssA
MKFLSALLLGLVQAQSLSKSDEADNKKVCRLLSLAGGGSKGAYEVGAIARLTELLSDDDSNYDVVTGVSVGSINSFHVGLYAKEE